MEVSLQFVLFRKPLKRWLPRDEGHGHESGGCEVEYRLQHVSEIQFFARADELGCIAACERGNRFEDGKLDHLSDRSGQQPDGKTCRDPRVFETVKIEIRDRAEKRDGQYCVHEERPGGMTVKRHGEMFERGFI